MGPAAYRLDDHWRMGLLLEVAVVRGRGVPKKGVRDGLGFDRGPKLPYNQSKFLPDKVCFDMVPSRKTDLVLASGVCDVVLPSSFG